nr:hypothetical protein [Tanacetum cinerariifolium]
MSDASSAVTYTSVYTNSEPWRYYGDDSAKTGPPRFIVYGYDGLPIQPVALPFPDYVPGPEHPPSPDYMPGPKHPPLPVEIPYVPDPEYPEYLAPSDDEAPLEDQPLPADDSPIAASLDYVEDFDQEDLKDDQADYPADGGDGDDEPFDDDDDDDTDDKDPVKEPLEDKEDDEEEEEHLASADPSTVPIVDHTRLRRVRKSVRPEPPMLASMKACIARHAVLPSPPLPIPSPLLPLPSPLTTSLIDTGAPLGYKAVGIRMRVLLPSTSRRTDTPETDMPPRKRACLTTLAPGFEIRESSAAGAARQLGPPESDLRRYRVEQAGYGTTDMWDEIVDTLMEIAPTTLEGVNERVTEIDTTIRQRMDEFEIHFEEAQDNRALLRARVNTLFRDRPDHCRTAMLMDREAMHAHEAWAYSVDMSSAIAAHVRILETQVAALISQTSSLQTQLTTTLGRIEILDARDPDPQEGPAEAGSSSGDADALEADEPTHVPGSPIIIAFSQTRLRRARKSVRPEPPMLTSMKACIARHAALPSPPLPIPSPLLPLPSTLTTSLIDTGAPLGYKAVGIRMRVLLPSTSRGTDTPETNMPPRKRACLTTLAPGFEIRESSAAGAARQLGPT